MPSRFLSTTLALWAIAVGIEASPRVLDLRAVAPADPATGVAVTIALVEDARGETPSGPSRTRTIGIDRKGNDLMLPEGRDLETLVREIVTKAFREEGFRVVSAADDIADAIPVHVRVEHYWGGGWTKALVVYYNFRGILNVKANLPGLESGARIESSITRGSWGANVGFRWVSSQQEGVDELVAKLRSQLHRFGKSAAASNAEPEPEAP